MDLIALLVVLLIIAILCAGTNYFLPKVGATPPFTYIVWAVVAVICLFLLLNVFGIGVFGSNTTFRWRN